MNISRNINQLYYKIILISIAQKYWNFLLFSSIHKVVISISYLSICSVIHQLNVIKSRTSLWKKKVSNLDSTLRIITESCQVKHTVSKRFCLSFMPVGKTEREEANGERPAKSLDIEIGGRFPLILNKEHKVVLFPPGFQTVRNPPGVKRDPPSLSFSLVRVSPSSWSWNYSFSAPPCLLAPFRSRETNCRAVYWCCKFNFSFRPRTIVQRERGEKPQKGLRPGEGIVSLSLAIVRVTAREIRNLSRFFLLSPLFFSLALSLSLSLPLRRKGFPTSSSMHACEPRNCEIQAFALISTSLDVLLKVC